MIVISDKSEIIHKHNNFYTIEVRSKNLDNSYSKYELPVFFRKGIILEDLTRIKIKIGWLKTDGKNLSLFVENFELKKQRKNWKKQERN